MTFSRCFTSLISTVMSIRAWVSAPVVASRLRMLVLMSAMLADMFVVRHAQSLFATDIGESIREGVAAGLFAPVPIDVAAQAVVGMATQILSWWTEHESVSMQTLEDTMSRIALYGIVPRT